MTTVSLYDAPGACSSVPHAAMESIAATCGEPFDYRMVKLHPGETHTPDHLAMNPDGQVPMLVVDGRVLTQIVGILGCTAYRGHPVRLQTMTAAAGRWLSGVRAGALDACALTLYRWGGPAGIDPATLPTLREHVARVVQQPAIASAMAMARERITLDAFKPSTV